MIDKTFNPKLMSLTIKQLGDMALNSLTEARTALLELHAAGISADITKAAKEASDAMTRNIRNLEPCANLMANLKATKATKARGGKA